jgi:hypothetical protein
LDKYHVALSFAGEDREYVEAVARLLQQAGVRVFYDRFEETKLWGKDLYSYLSEIYQYRAIYTVLFVSKAYRDKLWSNHERKAAQARAFSENKEYILPAVFDSTVEIPGLLKTTGYINLQKLTPKEFAKKLLQKLRDDNVILVHEKFSYSAEAKADVDFPLSVRNKVTQIVEKLKSHNWYKQNPAVEQIFVLDWTKISADQAFVLGRNLYQCACGGERRAATMLDNLRGELAKFPQEIAEHLLNGMFYEVYFDPKGVFRGHELKGQCINGLFSMQSVEKYRNSIEFIRQALAPYRDSLVIMPNTKPQILELNLKIAMKSPPVVRSIECLGKELLIKTPDDKDLSTGQLWKLSFKKFKLDSLKESISDAWHVPLVQIRITLSSPISPSMQLSLPDGTAIRYPLHLADLQAQAESR